MGPIGVFDSGYGGLTMAAGIFTFLVDIAAVTTIATKKNAGKF